MHLEADNIDKVVINDKNVRYYTEVFVGSNSQNLELVIDTSTDEIIVGTQEC